MTEVRFGRLPHDPRPARLSLHADHLRGYVPRPTVDWLSGVKSWPMLANDRVGDCTCAGAGHIAQQINWYGQGQNAPVTEQDAIAMYELLGYRPGDSSTDLGATLQQALDVWRSTGIGGNKIAAFAQVDATDLDTIRACIDLFGAVYTGMNFPKSAMDQFNAGKEWTVARRTSVEGGHCVPIGAYDADGFTCVTWGRAQRMDVPFFRRWFDEVWTPIDLDWLHNNVSPGQLDAATLNAKFLSLTGQAGPFPVGPAPVPTPAPMDPADAALVTAFDTWKSAKGAA